MGKSFVLAQKFIHIILSNYSRKLSKLYTWRDYPHLQKFLVANVRNK